MPQTLENGNDVSLCNSNAGLRAEATKTKESKLVDKKNKNGSHLGENILSSVLKGMQEFRTEELGVEEHWE